MEGPLNAELEGDLDDHFDLKVTQSLVLKTGVDCTLMIISLRRVK